MVRKLQEEIPEVIVPALYLFSRHHTRQTTQNHTKWRPAVAVLTVVYAFSNDGTNYTQLAVITRPYVSDADQIKNYRTVGLTETARYVRATVNGSSGWSLTDEIEVRGAIAGIQPSLTVSTPTPAAANQGQEIAALQLAVTESAGPLTWTADGLPSGLTIGRITGIVTGTPRTAGTYTITVTATSTSGRTGRTAFPWAIYAAVAAGPVMDSGTVSRFGADVKSGGVAVLNGFAYTVVGYKVVKLDIAAGKDAVAQPVAGGDSYGCLDAGNGDQVRFNASAPRVIGTDGSLIYVLDSTCVGLRAVNPKTGATRSISTAPVAGNSTIAGRYLYTIDIYGKLWRYDLQAGQSTRLFDGLTFSGALAADNTYLWVLNNTDIKLHRLPLNGDTADIKTFPLPTGGFTAARSAGDYVYYTDSRNLLTRITKTDGALQLVAGDGAHNDDLLYNTTAIASDGTDLYTAGDRGVAKLTTTPRVIEEPAATAPVDFGDVRPLGPTVKSGGVAVLNGFAYTVVGYKVVKLDIAAGNGATAQTVAGNDTSACLDAGSGDQARLNTLGARVIGTDGSLIYVLDYHCGLRAVNPTTGATRTISAPVASSSAIAGRYLYTIDIYGKLWRYDLQAGQPTRLFDGLTFNGYLAADNTNLWVLSNSDNKIYRLSLNGTAETKTFPLPAGGITAARSAGDYVYYTDNRNLLTRISKTDGTLQIVAGDGAHGALLYDTNGITTDGTFVFASGARGLVRLTSVLRTFGPPATGPVLESGRITRYGPETWAAGVTVLDGYAYTHMGYKLVRFNIAAGEGAAPETVAGSDTYGCNNSENGTEVSFYTAKVIGNDGELIYVNDPNCGLRTVNPNGTTQRIKSPVGTPSAVAGKNLYSVDNYGKISRYDLRSGQTIPLFGDFTISGAIAADNDFVWGFNSSGKLYGLPVNPSIATIKEFVLPNNAVFAALSVGNYVYFVDGRSLLSRISKTDGSVQIVAGDGAHQDDLISTTVGIAADGNKLYTAGKDGLYVISEDFREFDWPITDGAGPKLGIDSPEKRITTLPGSPSGVAVLGWYAYTASGLKVSKTNIHTGETATVAGGINGCGDASLGENATFTSASVVGSDGSLIYIYDSSCGLRAVNPTTGSTRTLRATVNQQSSIAGEYLYTIASDASNRNTLYQYGLKSGITNKVWENLPAGSLMAAHESGVYIVNGNTKTAVEVKETGGKQLDSLIGKLSANTENLPYRVMGSRMAYADHALYVIAEISEPESQQPTLRLARIDAVGAMNVIGNSSEFLNGTNTGLAVTKTDVYRLNSPPSAVTDLVRTHTGGIQDEDPDFQVDLSLYVDKDTRFIPVDHPSDKDYFSEEHLLFWDPETMLCVSECQGIKTLAAELHDRPAGEAPWPSFTCRLGISDCTVDDYEIYIVEHFVKKQGFYNTQGDILPSVKDQLYQNHCQVWALVVADCYISPLALWELIDTAETIQDVYEATKDILRWLKHGVRPAACIPLISPNSFRGDTPVLMADGSSAEIQDIQPGQRVLATDPSSEQTSAQLVTAVHVTTDTELTDLNLVNGSVIHTTAHHPFWAPEKREWTDAEDLAAGMILSSTNGATVAVKSVHNFTGSLTMYNLTVDRIHTYYVTAGGTPVLVHNSNRFCQEAIAYASDDLSRMAWDARKREGLFANRNIAVAYVPGWKDKDTGLPYVIGISRGNDTGAFHSEDDIIQKLIDGGFSEKSIKALYSERSVCSDCEPYVANFLADDAKVTYSVLDGRGSWRSLSDRIKEQLRLEGFYN
jgi:hypothetical protein